MKKVPHGACLTKGGKQLFGQCPYRGYTFKKGLPLGNGGATKTDEFSEKLQREGGVIFNPKVYVADFGNLNRAF